MNWFLYSMFSAISFSVMVLIFKKLGDAGVKESTILFYVFGLGTLFYLTHSLITKNQIKVDWWIVGLLLIATLLSYLGNLFHVKALISSPNPGYADAVMSMRVLLVAVAAVFLFHVQLTLVKTIGIAFAIVGFILLGL